MSAEAPQAPRQPELPVALDGEAVMRHIACPGLKGLLWDYHLSPTKTSKKKKRKISFERAVLTRFETQEVVTG